MASLHNNYGMSMFKLYVNKKMCHIQSLFYDKPAFPWDTCNCTCTHHIWAEEISFMIGCRHDAQYMVHVKIISIDKIF